MEEIKINIQRLKLIRNYFGEHDMLVSEHMHFYAAGEVIKFIESKDWVEAQMAIVEAQLADMAEVFLPYAITNRGTTVYQMMKEDSSQLLLSN